MDDNRIGDQTSKFGNEADSGLASGVETVTDLADEARTAMTDAESTIRDAAIETGKRIGAAAAKTYRQGVQAGEYVRKNTVDQPLLALLIAGAIGYGIAYMVHRR
jgi:hypothetical protein